MFDLDFLWFLIAGFLAGIPGGMGMGGGTVLIPILIVFLGVTQHNAQAVNLITFIPMAIVVLIFHFKNKLVKVKDLLWLIIPAVVFGVGASLLATVIKGEILKRIFGGFLIVLSVIQFFSQKIKQKAQKMLK
ncbi:MAG: sulfite exporter TauE/SafE family protein [Clostridia bacterium]|nr:sulfite exporter TauE/SafE family protein [Clostridia bacterium]